MTEKHWDKEVDLLVVGSGAGALAAAVAAADRHANVLVVEKSNEYGGTSAMSGGGIWIINSRQAREAGLEDSEEEAFEYIRGLSAPNVPDSLIRTYVQRSGEMLAWLEDHTPVRYFAAQYPDYHVENPGGKQGYRTHLPLGIDGRLLGDDILTLRSASPAASLFGIINWKFEETYTLLFRPKGWFRTLMKMLWRYASDIPHRFRSRKDRTLTLGNALVGGLRIALNQRKVPLWLNSPLVDLIREGDRVAGAVVRHEGKDMRIRARKGVLLAAGGFERNAEMRARYLPGSSDPTVSGSQTNNMGEAIVAAERIGAGLRNMQSTWSAPVFRVPGEESSRLSTIERALPGCIIVNQAGKRYLNEAASYHLVGREMVAQNKPDAGTQPSWFIFDHEFRNKYPAGPVMPLVPDALQFPGVRKILKKASSIEALAAQIGVPPQALKATIERFNKDAEKGEDSEFHRGAAAYDRMYGDPRVQPNPTLAPIRKAPFYAIPIYGGDIGTNGGVVTDENGRVLDEQGRPIQGLYASGNMAASVMGESYPGAGSTLGPALTFGYIAALHATGANG
jgi:3-oxosteroid 1-dehydrogenase